MSKLDILATIDAHITDLNRARRYQDADVSDWLWVIVCHLSDLADILESEAITETLAKN